MTVIFPNRVLSATAFLILFYVVTAALDPAALVDVTAVLTLTDP